MQPRLLLKDTRSMCLQVSSETFVNTWFNCWKNKTPSVELLKQITPFFDKWENQLRGKDHNLEINYLSLCHRLSYKGLEPLSAIRAWVKETDLLSSVRDELILIFIEQMHKRKKFFIAEDTNMAEYTLAIDFRSKLGDLIIKSLVRKRRLNQYEVLYTTQDAIHPDWFLLKNIPLDAWERYILELLRRGFQQDQIANISHIYLSKIQPQEREVWKQINAIYSTTQK